MVVIDHLPIKCLKSSDARDDNLNIMLIRFTVQFLTMNIRQIIEIDGNFKNIQMKRVMREMLVPFKLDKVSRYPNFILIKNDCDGNK